MVISEIILKDIEVTTSRNSTKNVLSNSTKMSPNGKSSNGWLAQGTHWGTYMSQSGLHLISDGHGDNRPNRMEIDMSSDICSYPV